MPIWSCGGCGEDMPWTPAGVLHRRFLGWTRDAELPNPAVPQQCRSARAEP
ncbi:hypothetical protein [Micromonospora sp. NBRC 107095]|uniref:hypothetical protein n=1 Tax=Micromonospora sp. NBRC 107095 TaxID=3032209 RepID=UPI0025548940|nr:hypothetical protein [Micromonospora sp. NBRC 107095]